MTGALVRHKRKKTGRAIDDSYAIVVCPTPVQAHAREGARPTVADLAMFFKRVGQ